MGLEKLVKTGKNIGRVIKRNARTGIMILGIGVGSYFIDRFMSRSLSE